MSNQYTKVAIGDIGTQIFWYNSGYKAVNVTEETFSTLKNTLYKKNDVTNKYEKLDIDDVFLEGIKYYQSVKAFEYAVPVTAGAEFGGDTESFDAPETDLDYTPRVAGRPSLSDISYTSNYTAEKYRRIQEISSNIEESIYMEVLQDASAMIFKGTSGFPTLTSGDVRQINWTVIPSFVKLIADIRELDDEDIAILDALNNGESAVGIFYNEKTGDTPAHIRIDIDSIPTIRQKYKASEVKDTKEGA